MRVRAVACRLLLAVLLVFAQQAGMLHELQHAFDKLAQTSDTRKPQKDVCPQCVAFAGVHHAAGGALPLLPLVRQRHPRPDATPFGSAPAVFTASYLSRAPPAHS